MFQSPSFRGGSTPVQIGVSWKTHPWTVSIPFVSGREHSLSAVLGANMRRLSFNPLRFGAGALPVAYFCAQSVSFLGFNPLRFGAGALPPVFLEVNEIPDPNRFNPLRFGAGALPYKLLTALMMSQFRQCFNPLRF